MTAFRKDLAYCIQWAMKQCEQSETPKLDAEVLLCHLLNKDRSYLFTWHDQIVADDIWEQFSAFVARRQQGEPVAHILGFREFWSLQLEVSPDTLIPRPDTEILVEHALACLPSGTVRVLDLGTGTGAVALAIASESPDATVVAVEYQANAIELAKRNAQRCNLALDVLHGSWFEPLVEAKAARFDVIVSNPPYIEPDDPHLSQGDVRFEPLSALVAPEKGLADLRHIIDTAPAHLTDGGWLLVEHGYDQGDAVRDLFELAGYQQVKTQQDYGHNDRITLGQFKL